MADAGRFFGLERSRWQHHEQQRLGDQIPKDMNAIRRVLEMI